MRAEDGTPQDVYPHVPHDCPFILPDVHPLITRSEWFAYRVDYHPGGETPSLFPLKF